MLRKPGRTMHRSQLNDDTSCSATGSRETRTGQGEPLVPAPLSILTEEGEGTSKAQPPFFGVCRAQDHKITKKGKKNKQFKEFAKEGRRNSAMEAEEE